MVNMISAIYFWDYIGNSLWWPDWRGTSTIHPLNLHSVELYLFRGWGGGGGGVKILVFWDKIIHSQSGFRVTTAHAWRCWSHVSTESAAVWLNSTRVFRCCKFQSIKHRNICDENIVYQLSCWVFDDRSNSIS
jgi:hypothetical protein